MVGHLASNKVVSFAGLKERTKKFIFRIARKIPLVAKRIDKEMEGVAATFEKSALERAKAIPFLQKLHDKGMCEEDILSAVNEHLKLGMS